MTQAVSALVLILALITVPLARAQAPSPAPQAEDQELKARLENLFKERQQNLKNPKGATPKTEAMQAYEDYLKSQNDKRAAEDKRLREEAMKKALEEAKNEVEVPDSEDSPDEMQKTEKPPAKPQAASPQAFTSQAPIQAPIQSKDQPKIIEFPGKPKK